MGVANITGTVLFLSMIWERSSSCDSRTDGLFPKTGAENSSLRFSAPACLDLFRLDVKFHKSNPFVSSQHVEPSVWKHTATIVIEQRLIAPSREICPVRSRYSLYGLIEEIGASSVLQYSFDGKLVGRKSESSMRRSSLSGLSCELEYRI